MTNHESRFAEILEGFQHANGEYERSWWKVTPEHLVELKHNRDVAKQTLLDAGNKRLEENGDAIELAFKAAETANKLVEEAVKKGQAFTVRLKKLSDAVKKGRELFIKATGGTVEQPAEAAPPENAP
jgi:hypothetical protein